MSLSFRFSTGRKKNELKPSVRQVMGQFISSGVLKGVSTMDVNNQVSLTLPSPVDLNSADFWNFTSDL
jgi:hypothetical protein